MDSRGTLLGWEAVGRVDLPGGYCTGALVASDVVLTAAHCVHDRMSGAPISPEGITFRAGYHHGSEITSRRVLRWVTPPEYETHAKTPEGMLNADAISTDVALLKLDSPVSSAEADPFRLLERAADGSEVSVASYGQGRDQVLSREADCNVRTRYAQGIYGFDCTVTFGSSGAPVFSREDGRMRILSVISSVSNSGESFGPDITARVPELSRRLNRENARPVSGTGARRITVGGSGDRGSIGARFVKP
ncbi:serine protease [Salipiger pallidus]|uniref:Serine protease n=1 Tax=Salipiger pallidus TaxID=1775170 RepID=A0A8J2ZL52_9RHOB|nr:trypsin-like peptidase domain-containing protein [Salipiger pallidus]GGG78165.1 serine protease [Salipiger pallidus]